MSNHSKRHSIFWEELLIAAIPAILSPLVHHVGEVIRDYISDRRESKEPQEPTDKREGKP